MKHIRLISFLTLLGILTACHQSPKGTYSYYDNGAIKSWEYLYPKGSDFYLKKIEYYPNGKKKSEGNFNVIHNRDGRWKFWYENGNIWVIGNFSNGLSKGRADIFSSTGERNYTAHYDHGRPHGLWLFYDHDKVIKKVWFKHGKKVREINLK